MRKEITIAILVLLGFVSFLWFEKPLREYLSPSPFKVEVAKLVSGILVRTVLIAVVFWLIKKLQLTGFNGLHHWQRSRNIHATVMALAFILMGIFGSWDNYASAETEMLILFLLSTFAVGIIEELAFRGTIFPLFIKSLRNFRRPILTSAVLSSLMFGLVHFVNLFSQPENIVGVASQVFFATAIGVFFCGLMVRTENILIPCIIHALINFSFGTDELKQSIENIPEIEKAAGVNWNSLIPTTIFFLFIFAGGVYMISKSDQEAMMDKLENG